MQKSFLNHADRDARANTDKAFEARAMQAQRKDCERTMKTKRAAAPIIESYSMFGEAEKPADQAGNISLF